MIDPKMILDPKEVASFVTPEESLNYLRSQIQSVRDHLASMPPPPTQEIALVDQRKQIEASQRFLSWHNRLLITYGRAVGSICTAQAYSHITVEEFQDLKKELIAVTVRRSANFQKHGV